MMKAGCVMPFCEASCGLFYLHIKSPPVRRGHRLAVTETQAGINVLMKKRILGLAHFCGIGFLLVLFTLGCSTQPPESPREYKIPSVSSPENHQLAEISPGQRIEDLTAAPDGSLYLVNTGGRALYHFLPGQEELTLIDPPREDWQPRGVAAGPDGLVYVAAAKKVFRLDPAGKRWFEFPELNASQLSDLVCDATGDVWLLDAGQRQVRRFQSSGREVPLEWDKEVLKHPFNLALDHQGRLLCGDGHQVHLFSRRGRHLNSWTQDNRRTHSDRRAPALVTDATGFIYTTHPDLHTLEIWSPEGGRLSRWNRSIAIDEPLRDPVAVTIADNRLYMAHRQNNLVSFKIDYAPPEVVPADQGVVPEGPNIVMITVDTTRLDSLGFAGYERNTSPNMDNLAAKGVWFPKAYACSGDTAASHCSIMTSLQPFTHEARNLGFYLRPEFITIAELLEQAGYRTAAFTSGVTLRNEYTWLDQGFQVYDQLNAIHEGKSWEFRGKRIAEHTNRQVFKWLNKHQGEKIFLWVHYFDPHTPYLPPEEFLDRFQYDPSAEGMADRIDPVWIGESYVGELIDRYDGEVAYMDHHLGRLVRRLEELGYSDELFILVVADHGEIMYERPRNAFSHSHTLMEVEMRIPLIMRDYTGNWIPEAATSEWTAELIDVAPTLTEVAGVEAPAQFQGVSLLEAMRGQMKPRPFTWTQKLKQPGGDPLRHFSLRRPPWKIKANTTNDNYWMSDLRDRPEDPGELNRLSLSSEELAERLGIDLSSLKKPLVNNTGRLLVYWMSPEMARVFDLHKVGKEQIHQQLNDMYGSVIGWEPQVLQDTEEVEEPGLSEERREQMEALGYLGG
jgi:arylsulfatase A-like enzyme